MPDERPSDVLGALPRRRPQRRSDKRRSREPAPSNTRTGANRSAAAGTATAERPPAAPAPARATQRRRTQTLRQPAQPPGTPPTSHERPADRSMAPHILGTAAQAAAELAGIGLSISARAVRNAVDRLPRP
jgi:hypothetical protein